MKKFLNFLVSFSLATILLTSCADNSRYYGQMIDIESQRPQQENVDPVLIGATDIDESDEFFVDNQKSIKVALLLPLSGDSKKLGNVLLNAAHLSLSEISGSARLVLMPFDTKGTTFGASAAIKEAINNNVDIVVGPIFSDEVKAISKIAQKHNLTVLSFSNNQDLIETGPFLMGFMPEQQIERSVTYAINQDKINFAAILPNTQYGYRISKILKSVVERKDGNLIKSEFYFASGRGLEKSVKRIVDSFAISQEVYEEYEAEPEEGAEEEKKQFIYTEEDKIYPDVIFVPESGKMLNKIVTLINKYNVDDKPFKLIGSSQWDKMSTASNLNLVGSWFASPIMDKYAKFERKYYRTYNTFPGYRISSISFDAVKFVNYLVNRKKLEDLSPESLLDYKGFSGIDGSFRLLRNGIVERRFAMIEVDNGGFKMIDKPDDDFFKY